jgi:hypothetical protein
MFDKPMLREYKSFKDASVIVESMDDALSSTGKSVCMKGVFIEGDVRNHNQRIYPSREIARAVNSMKERMERGESIPGEIDHPPDLAINLDRVSHMITEIWMDGNVGYGKLKLLETPMGNIARALIQGGMKLGVSSRGSGNVNDNGMVSDFDIITVDIVAQPSAPNAYPQVIYESLYNMKGGMGIMETARAATYDPSASKFLVKDALKLIKELKIK